MTLEQQVSSKESSQRLRELGVPQESLFSWIYTDAPLADGSRWKLVVTSSLGDSHWELGGEKDTYSAFTVAELGEMLPEEVTIKGEDCSLEMVNPKWYSIRSLALGKLKVSFEADTEAEARAKMIIYLLENKLITL